MRGPSGLFVLCLAAVGLTFLGGWLPCVAALVGETPDQEEPAVAELIARPPGTPVPIQPIADESFDGSPLRSPDAHVRSVRLRVDGNLAGVVTMLDPDGRLMPAQARIALLRDGKIIASARSDDVGAFQIPAVEPGVYPIIAMGPGGFAAATIRVLALEDATADGDDLVKLALIPSSDVWPDEVMMREGCPESLSPCCPPPCGAPMYGGGGGGMGAGGGFLPLAGLAGLAGIGGGGGGWGGGGGGGPASPHTP